MKISPVMSPANSVQANSADSVSTSARKITMSTNASPDRFYEEDVAPLQESTTKDTLSETNAVVEATQPLSPQLAALAKQKRALQVKERELADREKALSSKPEQSGWISPDLLKSEPLRVLLDNGVTYDQLTEHILASQGNQEINSLKAEIEALKKGVDDKFNEQVSQQEQQVLNEMTREAQNLAQRDPAFEMVKETGSVPDVMDLIKRTYRETGEVMDVQEAMQLVEDYLVNEGLRIASIKKVQSRLAPSQPTQKPQRQMTTLTNRDNARVMQSRKARAIAAFQGSLKK